MTKVEEQKKSPPNAAFLKKAIDFLSKASCLEAVDFYHSMYSMPGCDDWLLAELGKEDLFFLLTHLLRRPDVGHPWLYDRCRMVEAEPDGHLDLWAREHYKSTIITFGLSIQDIFRDPEVTIGIFSHTRPIAKKFLLQIKTEFEVNDTIKALYPNVLWQKPKQDSPKWSEDEGIVVKRQSNPKESTVEAWGLVDGQPTSKHFAVLNYDDTVVRESVTSPTMIEKTTTAIADSYNLGKVGGVKRGIGTRWHFNDSYRTVLERGTFKPRIFDGTEGNKGDIKRPVLISKEAMAEKRRDMGVYVFGCQILQNPKADAVHGFQRGWLEYWPPDRGAGLNIYHLRDAANSKKQDADYTVDWIVGLGPDENFYVLAVYRDRLNLPERTDLFFELQKRWRPIETRYEEYGMQGDIQHLKTEMVTRKYRVRITKVSGRMPKPERIKRLIPLFEKRQVILPSQFHITTRDHETKDMVHEFVENEYMAFPVPAHDDMLDSLSRICDEEGHVNDEKVKLTLKWPAKTPPAPKHETYEPLDRGMGM